VVSQVFLVQAFGADSSYFLPDLILMLPFYKFYGMKGLTAKAIYQPVRQANVRWQRLM
jgi:hypothetical protein